MDDIWSLEAKIKAEVDGFSWNYSPASESLRRLLKSEFYSPKMGGQKITCLFWSLPAELVIPPLIICHSQWSFQADSFSPALQHGSKMKKTQKPRKIYRLITPVYCIISTIF